MIRHGSHCSLEELELGTEQVASSSPDIVGYYIISHVHKSYTIAQVTSFFRYIWLDTRCFHLLLTVNLEKTLQRRCISRNDPLIEPHSFVHNSPHVPHNPRPDPFVHRVLLCFVHSFTLGMSLLIILRRIFPLAVFGIDSTKRTPPRSFLIGDTLSEINIAWFAIHVSCSIISSIWFAGVPGVSTFTLIPDLHSFVWA